jgi:hypothetical protein
LETVFSAVVSAGKGGYKEGKWNKNERVGRQPPLREDTSMQAEE